VRATRSIPDDAPPPVRAGRRATRQLDATYRALACRTDHPTPEDVFRAVRVELPAISRGTVYRNLQKLVDLGRAQVVQVSDRATRYDGRVDRHDHFVCNACGLVADVAPSADASVWTRRRIAGHRVASRVLTYFGVCRSCEA